MFGEYGEYDGFFVRLTREGGVGFVGVKMCVCLGDP